MYKPTLHSHTLCQAAQANVRTKALQRVSLSQRMTKTTDNQEDEKEHQTDNRRLTQWCMKGSNQVPYFYWAFVQVDSFVLLSPPTTTTSKPVVELCKSNRTFK